MPHDSDHRSRAMELEIRLRSAITELAASDPTSEDAKLAAVESALIALEGLHVETGESLPWPHDTGERLSVCRMEVVRLREGKVRRRDALGKIRLLIPRFSADVPPSS